MDRKTCCRCKKTKSLSRFHKNRSAQDGLSFECKDCRREYSEARRDRIREYQRQYREANKDRLREYRHQYRETHEDDICEYRRRYYKANKARERGRADRWIEANKDRVREYGRKWKRNNPSKVRAFGQRRRTRKLGNGGSFTAQEWRELCERFGNVCLCCREHKKLCADHIVPVSKGGTSDISNIQPLCKSCNSKKRTQIVDYR